MANGIVKFGTFFGILRAVKTPPGRDKVGVIGVHNSYRFVSDRGPFAEVRSGINSDRLTLLNA